MATTRKSDFVGDTFGSWRVTERAEAEAGKRRWAVINDVTGETRVVLQTELKGLVKIPDVVVDGEGVRRNDLGQQVHGDADPIEIALGRLVTYEPAGEFCESAMIAAEVLDWTRDLPVEENPVDESDVPLIEIEGVPEGWQDPATVEALEALVEELSEALGEATPLVGRFAPEDISEAALDAQVPPQDPIRKAIRDTMGAMVEIRQGIQRAEAAAIVMNQEIIELQLAYEATLEKLDEALKAAITR